MTIDQLIAQARAAVAAKLEQRKSHTDAIEKVRAACLAEKRDPTDAEATEVRTAQDAVTAIDAETPVLREKVTELEGEKARDEAADRLSREFTPSAARPAYDRAARTGQEPRTYSPETARAGVSFFADAYASEYRANRAARERLERHSTEVQVEREMTERATNTASFAGLIVPQYLVDQAALVARAGRPLANIVQGLALPDQGTTFQIPRGTTGASAAVQASENASVSSTDEVWANVTLPVATIAGQQDVSRQSLDRGTPGIDSLIYLDLAGAYGVAVDAQVISGSGAAGQVLGIQNTAGVNQATAFAAAATAATFFTKCAGQLNAVETTRFLAPDVIVMHPRRWNWLIMQVDSQGRPLCVPEPVALNTLATTNQPIDTPSTMAVGTFLGLPVVTDASIPTSVGTGPEDLVFVLRRADALLFEDGDGLPRELRFEQTLGNQLTVKLVVYGYIAFTAGRYPTAVGIVGGNAGAGFGLIAPTF